MRRLLGPLGIHAAEPRKEETRQQRLGKGVKVTARESTLEELSLMHSMRVSCDQEAASLAKV